jgi:hypothetical protein
MNHFAQTGPCATIHLVVPLLGTVAAFLSLYGATLLSQMFT